MEEKADKGPFRLLTNTVIYRSYQAFNENYT